MGVSFDAFSNLHLQPLPCIVLCLRQSSVLSLTYASGVHLFNFEVRCCVLWCRMANHSARRVAKISSQRNIILLLCKYYFLYTCAVFLMNAMCKCSGPNETMKASL